MTVQPSDHDYTVATPENVNFGYAIAGLGSRFMAALVDSLLILLLQAFVVVLVFVIAIRDLRSSTGLLSWTSLVLVLISFFLFWGYYIFF